MHRLKKYKPGYSTSRRIMWINGGLAWIVILSIVWSALVSREAQAVSLASILAPSLLAFIAALLGIHRFAGAMDLRAAADFGRSQADEREDREDRAEDEGENAEGADTRDGKDQAEPKKGGRDD